MSYLEGVEFVTHLCVVFWAPNPRMTAWDEEDKSLFCDKAFPHRLAGSPQRLLERAWSAYPGDVPEIVDESQERV